jgi:4-carboxymuconolactone decarboxylase
MARIGTIAGKDELAPEYHPTYDEIARTRGRVGGPFIALFHSPELAARTARLGSYIRFESSLDRQVIELTALAAARELGCRHEWAAHIRHAQHAGIPVETIRLIHQSAPLERYAPEQAELIGYVQELIRHRNVSERTFQAVLRRLGERGVVELTATIGYYVMLACTLNAFEIQTEKTPEGFEI